MPDKKAYPRLKTGDHVTIPSDGLCGIVAETLPHEVIVRLTIDGAVEHRRYSMEFVAFEAGADEVTRSEAR